MRYLISVIHDQAGLPTPDEMAAIDMFNDGSRPRATVFAGGLASPNAAIVIDNRGGEVMVTDGAFSGVQGSTSSAPRRRHTIPKVEGPVMTLRRSSLLSRMRFSAIRISSIT